MISTSTSTSIVWFLLYSWFLRVANAYKTVITCKLSCEQCSPSRKTSASFIMCSGTIYCTVVRDRVNGSFCPFYNTRLGYVATAVLVNYGKVMTDACRRRRKKSSFSTTRLRNSISSVAWFFQCLILRIMIMRICLLNKSGGR